MIKNNAKYKNYYISYKWYMHKQYKKRFHKLKNFILYVIRLDEILGCVPLIT